MARTNPTNLRNSMSIQDYVFIREDPIDEEHGVRLKDLRASQYNYLFNGVPLNIMFPGIDVSQISDKTAFYVAPNGVPKTARNTEDNATGVVAIRNGNLCFVNNTIIRDWSSGMTPGTEYWLSPSGTLGSAPLEEGRWSVRLGIALNSRDLLTSFHISGKN